MLPMALRSQDLLQQQLTKNDDFACNSGIIMQLGFTYALAATAVAASE
jgi:hypothetical protein